MEEHRGRMKEAADVLAYIQGGRGRFTLVSGKTGTRFTYKAGMPQEDRPGQPQKPVFLRVLTDDHNEGRYEFLGTLWGTRYNHGKRSRILPKAPSAQAIAWLMGHLAAGNLPAAVEFWHEGRCGRCGRALTVPESIQRGLGPVCAGQGSYQEAA